MTEDIFSREAMLIGEEGVRKLSAKKVAVFGIGGVGGHAAEALVRSGIGEITLVDHDTVSVSNLNRQLIALQSTVGMEKTTVAKARFLDINPNLTVHEMQTFFLPETASSFNFSQYDYVLDCIDTVSGKLSLIEHARAAGVPIICAMGAGNKLNPLLFEVADISKTSVCPLAKVMRRELKNRGIRNVKVVYSKEEAAKTGERTPGSIAFVPSVMGLLMASEVVRDLLNE